MRFPGSVLNPWCPWGPYVRLSEHSQAEESHQAGKQRGRGMEGKMPAWPPHKQVGSGPAPTWPHDLKEAFTLEAGKWQMDIKNLLVFSIGQDCFPICILFPSIVLLPLSFCNVLIFFPLSCILDLYVRPLKIVNHLCSWPLCVRLANDRWFAIITASYAKTDPSVIWSHAIILPLWLPSQGDLAHLQSLSDFYFAGSLEIWRN